MKSLLFRYFSSILGNPRKSIQPLPALVATSSCWRAEWDTDLEIIRVEWPQHLFLQSWEVFFKCKITISSPISCYNRIKPGLGLSSTHNNKWMFAWAAKGEDKQAPSDLGAVRLWKHVHTLEGIKITGKHSRTCLPAQTHTHTRVCAVIKGFFQTEMVSNRSKTFTMTLWSFRQRGKSNQHPKHLIKRKKMHF